MLRLLERMKLDVTVHGFRSTFRDWAEECTNYPRRVIELALAHGNPDEVEAAYLRSELLDRRRALMDEWAAYCRSPLVGTGDNVTSIAEAKKRAG
jgi:integrase